MTVTDPLSLPRIHSVGLRHLEMQPHSSRPAIVIGLGEFGQQTLLALDAAVRTRHILPAPLGLWAGPNGWSLQDVENLKSTSNPSDGWPDAAEWWQAYATAGAEHLQAAFLRALRASPPALSTTKQEQAALDVYLIAHLHESFALNLWHKVISSARATHTPAFGMDHIYTLILATDSLAFPLTPPTNADALLTNLDTLEAELLAADERELPGRVGWCYLLDTLDTHGQLLTPLQVVPEGNLDGPNHTWLLQAHQAAEFIALLAAGLRHTPAYERTSLAHIHRDFRNQPPKARVSTFAAGSLTLPVSSIAERMRDILAHRLLADYVLGQDMPTDLPAARKLRARWLAECTLTPSDIRSRLARDRGGQLLEFPVEPPQVESVPDDSLINHLLNWDILLWQRWNRPDAPPAQLTRNAEALVAEAGGWLEREIADLLQHEIGGARVATLLIGEAERAMEEERQKPDLPALLEQHWFTALFTSLLGKLRPHDPATLPDLEASRRNLGVALRSRLNRKAVWARASLFGVVLLSFAWAAYLAAVQAAGLSGLFSLWLIATPFLALDLALLTGACWLLALCAGTVQLYGNERAIHDALEHMIADVRRKYRALMERALRAERERVYGGLRARLAEWGQSINSRCAVLTETLKMLEDDLKRDVGVDSLLTEHSLLAPSVWSSLFPQLDLAAGRASTDRFLHLANRASWSSESAPVLASALRTFADAELTTWRAGLDLAIWASQPDNPSLADLVKSLRARLRPAWPLSREERAGIETGWQRPVGPGRHAEAATPMMVVNFVGLPINGHDQPVSSPFDGQRDETFVTGESGRLAFVPTLHALELKRLRAWEVLKATAQKEKAEAC